MFEVYKGYLIKIISIPLPNRSNWGANVLVHWYEGNTKRTQPLDGPASGFESRKEADSWGVQSGRKWIDNGMPDPESHS